MLIVWKYKIVVPTFFITLNVKRIRNLQLFPHYQQGLLLLILVIYNIIVT